MAVTVKERHLMNGVHGYGGFYFDRNRTANSPNTCI